MKTTKECPPYLILDNGQYIFNGPYVDPVRRNEDVRKQCTFGDNTVQFYLVIEGILDETTFINEKGVIEYRDPHCKHCFSDKMTRKSFNKRKLILENGKSVIIKVKRYYCKNCRTYSQVGFNGIYDDYCNFSVKMKNKAVLDVQGGWVSLRHCSSIFKNHNNVSISHETIRKELLSPNGCYYKNDDLILSKYYGYDVQWIKINKKWYYRHVLFDLVNHVPVAELLVKNETLHTTKKFIQSNLEPKDCIAIVTDLKPGYDKVMWELGFIHQHCIFHLLQNIYNYIKKDIKIKKREYALELKKKDKSLTKSQIEKIVSKKIEAYQEEIEEYMELFRYLFKQQTYDKALAYIELLKQELKNFPTVLKNYLSKNFFPEYKKFLYFLKKPYKGKLNSTNNQTENYIGNTMPKSVKKIYRTPEGMFSQIIHRKDGWGEKRKLELTC